jgi:hypothetical protein
MHIMRCTALVLAAAVPYGHTWAASVQCKLGMTRCIKSQGTEIPSKQVIEILDRCGDFTEGDAGARVLRMSTKEMLDRSGGKVNSISRAWYAFDYLYDSPLAFERKSRAEETNYHEIKRSCAALERDFNDDRKWTN